MDVGGVKNIAGAFYQPALTVCDAAFLKTLNEKELRAGAGELIKYALIAPGRLGRIISGNLPGALERRRENLAALTAACAAFKLDTVAKDEREESGLRELLNFGHTAGHAFEALSKGRLPHGDAVLWGLRYAARLSLELRVMDREYAGDIEATLNLAEPPALAPACLDFYRAFKYEERITILVLPFVNVKKINNTIIINNNSIISESFHNKIKNAIESIHHFAEERRFQVIVRNYIDEKLRQLIIDEKYDSINILDINRELTHKTIIITGIIIDNENTNTNLGIEENSASIYIKAKLIDKTINPIYMDDNTDIIDCYTTQRINRQNIDQVEKELSNILAYKLNFEFPLLVGNVISKNNDVQGIIRTDIADPKLKINYVLLAHERDSGELAANARITANDWRHLRESNAMLYEPAQNEKITPPLKLTEGALTFLKKWYFTQENIIIENLEKLKDKKYDTEKNFIDALNITIGNKATKLYQKEILKYARTGVITE